MLTESAGLKIRQLITQEGGEELMLRVYIQGGGCSGFQYGFNFEETQQDGDILVEEQGVTLLIDPLSHQYLAEVEIDYQESLDGEQFIVNNPNAVTTCGCGSSFSA